MARDRIREWGLEEVCLLVKKGWQVEDVGKQTHLTNPSRRGLYVVGQGGKMNPVSLEDVWDKIIDKGTCDECMCKKICSPDAAAVKSESGKWRRAVRPRQRG